MIKEEPYSQAWKIQGTNFAPHFEKKALLSLCSGIQTKSQTTACLTVCLPHFTKRVTIPLQTERSLSNALVKEKPRWWAEANIATWNVDCAVGTTWIRSGVLKGNWKKNVWNVKKNPERIAWFSKRNETGAVDVKQNTFISKER